MNRSRKPRGFLVRPADDIVGERQIDHPLHDSFMPCFRGLVVADLQRRLHAKGQKSVERQPVRTRQFDR